MKHLRWVLIAVLVVVAFRKILIPMVHGDTTRPQEGVLARWFGREIVAVMIENQEDARPHQLGLADALMVEEFLVEGGITRFATLFDRARLPDTVGPVRSLRSYFIDGVMPLASTLFFAGGSPEALARAPADMPASFNLLAYAKGGVRDKEIPAPHNLFLPREHLLGFLTDDGARTLWPPYVVGGPTGGASAQTVRINFHSTIHNVSYSYSTFLDAYSRKNGAVNDQAHPQNIAILEMPITGVGEKGRLDIPVGGRGRALYFRSGMVTEGTWQKRGEKVFFSFLDNEGQAYSFGRGQTWITVLPDLGRVTWE